MDSRLAHAVAVGRHGTISRAAEALHLSQSAVTKSIADLERQLGYQLFNRSVRGVTPTDAGRLFLERAQRIIADTAELLGGQSIADPYAGVLRIGVFPGTLEWILMQPLQVLVSRHPSVRLDLVTGNKVQSLRMLERGDVDIAISIEPVFEGRPQLHYERFGSLEPLAFVRRDHPVLNTAAPVNIAEYPLVLPTEVWEEQALRQLESSYGGDLDTQCHKIANFPLACKVVEASDAIGLVDKGFAETAYFRQRFSILAGFQLPKREVCWAVPKQWTVKPAAKALMAILSKVHGKHEMVFDIEDRAAPHERQ